MLSIACKCLYVFTKDAVFWFHKNALYNNRSILYTIFFIKDEFVIFCATKVHPQKGAANTAIIHSVTLTWSTPLAAIIIMMNQIGQSKNIKELFSWWSFWALFKTRGPRGPWNAHLRQKILKSSLFSLLYVQQATPGRSKSEGYSLKNN